MKVDVTEEEFIQVEVSALDNAKKPLSFFKGL
jgi:hypothetical protein